MTGEDGREVLRPTARARRVIADGMATTDAMGTPKRPPPALVDARQPPGAAPWSGRSRHLLPQGEKGLPIAYSAMVSP